ncbi:hypothetical protein OHD52_26850 [Escherichia coli]|nr:hypothetical protein [Escherichia coli]
MKALPTEPEAVVTQKDGLQGRVDALTGISVPESNDQNGSGIPDSVDTQLADAEQAVKAAEDADKAAKDKLAAASDDNLITPEESGAGKREDGCGNAEGGG